MLKTDFNHDWTVAKVESPAQTQPVTLPHDAMVHEARDEKAVTGAAGWWSSRGLTWTAMSI